MENTDYANTPAHAKFLLHSLEQAASIIGLGKNANKTLHMFKKDGDTLSGTPQNLEDQFI